MPRDPTETRNRLIREAERLFANRGVYGVTIREITEAAGQRNVSALNYHFGSREGILDEILLKHGTPLDDERGALLARLGEDATTRELIATLLVPYASRLRTPAGRDYLRIVAQLTGRFATWHIATELTPPNLRTVLALLEARRPEIPTPVRRERVVAMIMLMTTALAERARAMSSRSRPKPELDEATFVANLADVLVGVLDAPLGEPL